MDAVRTQQPTTGHALPLRIWSRLFWKEWREGWAVLAFGVLFPLLAFCLRHVQGLGLNLTMLASVTIIIALWAADRAARMDTGNTRNRTSLPIPPAVQWVFTYLVSLVIPALIAIPVGYVFSTWQGVLLNPAEAVPFTVLYMMAGFLLSTLLAVIYSIIPAVMVTVFWFFVRYDEVTLVDNGNSYLLLMAACLVLSLVWQGFTHHRRLLLGRILTAIVLFWVICNPWPEISSMVSGLNGPPSYPDRRQYSPRSLRSDDRACHVDPWVVTPGTVKANSADQDTDSAALQTPATVTFIFSDRRNDSSVQQTFHVMTQPLVMQKDGVILASQQRGERVVRLIEWNVRKNTTHEIGRFPVARDLLPSLSAAAFSPDRRYLAMLVPAQLPPSIVTDYTTYDVWVVDLNRQRAQPAAVNLSLYIQDDASPFAWSPNHLYLFGSGQNAVVNLRTLRGTLMDTVVRRKP